MPSSSSNSKNGGKSKTSPKSEKRKRVNRSSAETQSSPTGANKKEEKSGKRRQKSASGEGESSSGQEVSQPLLEARPGWDTIFFFFFLTHVLITVLWHSQMILPTKIYPQCLRDLTKTYSKDWQDPLNFSQKTPVWYLSIIYCEVFLQLPFHFVAIYVFWSGSHYHPWFRIPSIMYSIHVATTFMPIFAFLTSSETLTQCSQSRGTSSSCALGQTLRLKLIAVYYAPFFLIPLRLLTFSVFRTYENSPKLTSAASTSSNENQSQNETITEGKKSKDKTS